PERAARSRALWSGAGLALLVLPLVSPLDGLGDEELLSPHMLQHVLIRDAAISLLVVARRALLGAAAFALLVVAVRGPLVFFLLPPSVLKPLASFRPLRRLLGMLLVPLV